MDTPEYRVGRFTLRPFRQLLDNGAPVPIGRKALQLLSVLARAEGALVTKDELMAAVWPGVIVEDNAIQVHVTALRKVLGKDPELLSTSRGLGYRLAVSAGARPPEARETVPAAKPGAPPIAGGSVRGWLTGGLVRDLVAVALAIALAAGGGAWLKEVFRGGGPAKPPTIAVLAFQPADGGADARLFADGLAISLASALSRYDVTVIATSSSLQLTPAQKSEARARLGADYIVDGRIQSDEGKLTVSTQISDTRKNVLVYSFDVHNDSALNGALADQIATHLALTVDSKFIHPVPRSFTAEDFALIARANEAIGGGDMIAAMEPTRQLAERYPDDGELQAGAGVPIIYAAPGLPKSQQSQFLKTARAYIERGARLAPDSGMVLFARTQLPTGPMGLPTAERLLRRSLQASPTFGASYNALGEDMMAVGRIDEGVGLLQRSIQLDPLSDLTNGDAGKEFVFVGRKEEASEALARTEAIWPASPWVRNIEFFMATEFGTPQEMASVGKTYPLFLGHIGVATADLDLMRRALATRDQALVHKFIGGCFATVGKKPAAGEWDHACLLTMVRLGALDDAFAFAARAFPDTHRLYPVDDDRWVIAPPPGFETARLFSPAMAAFRNDPRFWPIAWRAGLIDYWRTTGEWPDFCRTQLETCRTQAARAVRAAGQA
ncbi:MAG TPA: winged helix-turn-helix domain-containing protein [Caulobacteraceae bacterium]|jgi:DNA-binding winged helix-turn-helix (wHTH) protein/TolB-like protein|nr:winged helix-turn-helix domain-containing protein [Caulobacteraceae bacterium]